MQVKKFEAKSMKEALNMVKQQLGPEAIILSARDNNKGFGLSGTKSVEITAAVSDETLRKKMLAEKKMNEELKSKFHLSSAKVQKDFIEKAFTKKEEKAPRPLTSKPYIEIDETSSGENSPIESNGGSQFLAKERIRSAVKSAVQAGLATMEQPTRSSSSSGKLKQKISQKNVDDSEVKILQQEIQHLRNLLEKFQKVPQSFISRHPGADEGLPYEVSSTFEKLVNAGISHENVVQLLKRGLNELSSVNIKKKAFVDAWVAKCILDEIGIVERQNCREKYQIFVGPLGGGKTSSLVKMASHLVIGEKRKVAIVSTDYNKVGAAEQLRIYAQILNVPFAVIRRKRDWEVIQSKIDFVDHLLVDFPGFNLKSLGEVDFLRELLPPAEAGRRIHFVQTILAKDAAVFDVTERYLSMGIQDVIFTCLDECAQHGLIYNFQKRFQLPLHSFGIGPKIPEDWERATKERVVDLIFKLTKFRHF